MTTVLASSALYRSGALSPGWIAMHDAMITEVGDGDAPRGATDLGDALLTPAFVDVQCNGVHDVDFATADSDGWSRARATLARHGVAAFCPTLVSAPLDSYGDSLDVARAAASHPAAGWSEILGVHLEGPFLGGAPGAHDPAALRSVDLDWLERVVAGWPGLVRMMTLAPEADPELAGTHALVAAGIVVALGHSTASFEIVCRAATAGASVVTHLFNGMGPFHHREPGLVGAGLTDERLTPTVIADLVHVHPAALRLAVSCKPDLAVVSDSVGFGAAVEPRGGAAWRADGTLAGATVLLDTALANLVSAGIPLVRAIHAVTAAPARIVGAAVRGTLSRGAVADVVALDPRSLEVLDVWLGGVPVASS